MPVSAPALLHSWTESAQRAISQVVQAIPSHKRPVVTLDFDNTCLSGDLGENLHYHLCESFGYAFDHGFFDAIEPLAERTRLQSAVARNLGLRTEDQDLLSLDLAAVYVRRLRESSPAEVYGWACTMHAGMTPDEVEAAALETLRREQARERVVVERVAPDGTPMRMSRGIRFRAAMMELIELLTTSGAEVWLVSATNEWAVRAAAPLIGIPRERVIGNLCEVRDGRICVERAGPTTYRAGKVEAIAERIGVEPLLAMGDTWTDVEMMESAQVAAILVDRGDGALRAHAEERGWAIVGADRLAASDQTLSVPIPA